MQLLCKNVLILGFVHVKGLRSANVPYNVIESEIDNKISMIQGQEGDWTWVDGDLGLLQRRLF